MRFPVPPGYFGDVDLSPAKRQQYHEVVRSRVSTMLADEVRYAERQAQQQPIVPAKEWKALSPMGELNIYQRRRNGRSDRELADDENFTEGQEALMHHNRSIVANGRVKGSIEDMLYGMSATTQGDMMTGLAFTAPPEDCVLLGVVERATVRDPMRSAELLWVLTKIPLIQQRDVCYLKATGVEQDRNGKYGYMILHSVDIPECPPFDSSTKVIRAKMFFSCLFRELTPGYIDVVARGIFDLSGSKFLKAVLTGATTSLLGGLLKGVECGKAKKLTLLARRNGDRRRAAISKQAVCSVCITGQKLFSTVKLGFCRVCGVVICSSCKAKGTRAFVSKAEPCVKITCCRNCEQQAASMTGIRPADPEHVVVADCYRRRNASALSSSSSSNSAVPAALSTPSLDSSTQRQLQETTLSTESGSREWTGKHEVKLLLSQTNSSVGMMTNSTVDESCASYDFADSDLNSEGNHFTRDIDDDEQEKKPGQTTLPELMKEYASIASPIDEADALKGVTAWKERHRINADDFLRADGRQGADEPKVESRQRHDNMYEWMKSLQSSANEAYYMTQASGEIMKKSLR